MSIWRKLLGIANRTHDVPKKEFIDPSKQDEVQARLAERLKKVPSEVRAIGAKLAQRGWYLVSDMPFTLLWDLRRYLDGNDYKSVDKFMVEWLDRHLDAIEKDVTDEFPKRTDVLLAAFRAHRNKEYYLSIPVFLSQSDGICFELLGVGVFAKRDGAPQTAVEIGKITAEDFAQALMEPLRISGALAANQEEREVHNDVLNRHEVLHGRVFDYGNRIDSFRCISLVHYLATTVVMVKHPERFRLYT